MVYSKDMTEMSKDEAREIHDEARRVIANGGTYTHTADDGSEVKIFYVAGGAFCRVDTRSPDRMLVAELSVTSQWTDVALRHFEAAVLQLSAGVEVAA